MKAWPAASRKPTYARWAAPLAAFAAWRLSQLPRGMGHRTQDTRSDIPGHILFAIGAVSAQVERMVLTESALIGCTAALSGVLLGALLSAYMVVEALRLQVGWQMRFHVPIWVVLEAFVAAQLVAWAAAFWPMRLASRLQLVEALQYE